MDVSKITSIGKAVIKALQSLVELLKKIISKKEEQNTSAKVEEVQSAQFTNEDSKYIFVVDNSNEQGQSNTIMLEMNTEDIDLIQNKINEVIDSLDSMKQALQMLDINVDDVDIPTPLEN